MGALGALDARGERSATMVASIRRLLRGRRSVLGVALAVALLGLVPGPAGAAADQSQGRRPLYYLALGDSLSRGVQPDAAGQNHPTDQGYADDLAKVGRLVLPQLQLVKLGCETEETTASMINGGRCAYPSGPAPNGAQLAQAEAFLTAHRGSTVLITLDIGANDLSRCLDRATGVIDVACVQATFAEVPGNLGTILERLRAAAGPQVPIIGMNYYSPFLASWLQGPAGQALARLSTDLIVQYNDLLEGAYGAAGVPVADVQAAFSTTDFDTLVSLPGFGQVPRNVARICQWTWMCVPPPMGPNIHARPEGYRVIAGAFVAALAQAHLDGNPLTSQSARLLTSTR
jgi:lysophospholipase L1-like esterase